MLLRKTTMTKAVAFLGLLVLGGCVGDNGSVPAGGPPTVAGHRKTDDDDGKPPQVCENTSVAGEPKTVCY